MTLGPPTSSSSSPELAVAKRHSTLALAFYQAPPANLGTITGVVKEDSDGGMTPLGGVTITATPGGSTKSGGGGTYVLTNLKPGQVQLTAVHPLTPPASTRRSPSLRGRPSRWTSSLLEGDDL